MSASVSASQSAPRDSSAPPVAQFCEACLDRHGLRRPAYRVGLCRECWSGQGGAKGGLQPGFRYERQTRAERPQPVVRRLGEREVALIRHLYDQGVTQRELALRFGISGAAVWRRLHAKPGANA
jgi:hypothetical protein